MFLNQFDQQADKMLVYWTYSKGEWLQYIKDVVRKRSLPRYIMLAVSYLFNFEAPATLISQRQLWIGEKEKINARVHNIEGVDLIEEGQVNILRITYSKKDRQVINELKILVPKGKLKEAISVQANMFKRN